MQTLTIYPETKISRMSTTQCYPPYIGISLFFFLSKSSFRVGMLLDKLFVLSLSNVQELDADAYLLRRHFIFPSKVFRWRNEKCAADKKVAGRL